MYDRVFKDDHWYYRTLKIQMHLSFNEDHPLWQIILKNMIKAVDFRKIAAGNLTLFFTCKELGLVIKNPPCLIESLCVDCLDFKRLVQCQLCYKFKCPCDRRKVKLMDGWYNACLSCVSAQSRAGTPLIEDTHSEDFLVLCEDCGKVQCGSHIDDCNNVFAVESLSLLRQCKFCNKFKSSLDECENCTGHVCVDCGFETNYKIFCPDCLKCQSCDDDIEPSCRWVCWRCGDIYCISCMPDDMCEKCNDVLS